MIDTTKPKQINERINNILNKHLFCLKSKDTFGKFVAISFTINNNTQQQVEFKILLSSENKELYYVASKQYIIYDKVPLLCT